MEDREDASGLFIALDLGRESSGEEKVPSTSGEELSLLELKKDKNRIHMVISKICLGLSVLCNANCHMEKQCYNVVRICSRKAPSQTTCLYASSHLTLVAS